MGAPSRILRAPAGARLPAQITAKQNHFGGSTEVRPIRALRNQATGLPGTGLTPEGARRSGGRANRGYQRYLRGHKTTCLRGLVLTLALVRAVLRFLRLCVCVLVAKHGTPRQGQQRRA